MAHEIALKVLKDGKKIFAQNIATHPARLVAKFMQGEDYSTDNATYLTPINIMFALMEKAQGKKNVTFSMVGSDSNSHIVGEFTADQLLANKAQHDADEKTRTELFTRLEKVNADLKEITSQRDDIQASIDNLIKNGKYLIEKPARESKVAEKGEKRALEAALAAL